MPWSAMGRAMAVIGRNRSRIVAGASHTLGLRTDGTRNGRHVVGVGDNSHGELGTSSTG